MTQAQFKVQTSKTALSSTEQQTLSDKLTEYALVEIAPDGLKAHMQQNHKNARITLPMVSGEPLTISLEEYDIRGANYRSVQTTDNGQVDVGSISECPTYKGVVEGVDASFVRLLVTNQTVQGVIFTKQTGYIQIEPLSALTANSSNN